MTLLPPPYVRPYVRRNKTDRTDADALLEAAHSGQIPAVPVKSVAQQTLVALDRIRDQWMTTRTARINTVRGVLRERAFYFQPARDRRCARFRRSSKMPRQRFLRPCVG